MLIFNPINSMFYFVVMGLDLVLFFLLIHLIMAKWKLEWLVPFEKLGSEIVGKATVISKSLFMRVFNIKISEMGALFASAMILSTIRFVLIVVVNGVSI